MLGHNLSYVILARNQEGENLLPNITENGFTQYHLGILFMVLLLPNQVLCSVQTDTGHVC